MKKVVSVLLILAFLLCGCSRMPASPQASGESAQPSQNASEQSGSESSAQASSGSSGDNTDSSESSAENRPRDPSAFFEKCSLRQGSETLYEVPVDLGTQGEFSKMERFGDQILFLSYNGGWTSGYDTELILYDPVTFSVTARVSPGHFASIPLIQVITDKIAVYEPNPGTLQVYDENLSLLKTEKINGGADCYLCADLETVCLVFWGQSVETLNLRTKKRKTVARIGDSFGCDTRGETVMFSMIDPETQVYRAATFSLINGQVESVPVCMDPYWLYRSGSLWLAADHSDASFWYLGNESDLFTFRSDNVERTLLEPGLMLETDENVIKLYRPDGECIGSAELNDPSFHTPMIYNELLGGYFFFETYSSGDGTMLFWRPQEQPADVPLESEPLPEPAGGTAVSAELYERAAEISEQYGIELLIADQCETNPLNFLCDQELDEEIIENALDDLEESLKRYPENFLPQLCYGHFPKIRIEFVCNLRRSEESMPEDPDSVNGFTSVAAFTNHLEGKYHLIVMGIEFGIGVDLYHELSHIIDQKLAWDSAQREDALYSEDGWLACSPEGFEYAYDYFYLPDEYFEDGYGDYFIDIYARTYPTEDRARIMEYAMGEPETIAEHQGMLRKLAYYSECIRDAFDTAGWPETTEWEQPLVIAGFGDWEERVPLSNAS